MVDDYRKETKIVELLEESHSVHTKRMKYKCMYLTRAQFNKAAGRDRVEESVFIKVAKLLRKNGLHLLRFEQTYVLISGESLASWPTPDEAELKRWHPAKRQTSIKAPSIDSKSKPIVSTKKQVTALSPAAAWPFPKGNQ